MVNGRTKTIIVAVLLFVVSLLGPRAVSSIFGENFEKELNHCLIQARILYDDARYEEAIGWWNKALALSPDNREALKYIKRVQDRVGKPTTTTIVSAPAAAQAPVTGQTAQTYAPDATAKVSLFRQRASKYIIQGKRYYCKHRFNWAISEWQKALQIDPGNTEVAEYIEKAQARLKEAAKREQPIEPYMMVNKPAPDRPREPAFERPTKEVLTLDEAIELGLKNHLPIRIAREQVKLARFKEKEVFRELFPAVSVRWDESSGVVSQRDYAGRKYQLRVQHPLYHGGELRFTWEQAKVNLKIAHENYEKAKEDYSLEMSKAYYELVKTQKNFGVQEVLLKDLERDLSLAKKEYESGLTTLVEFLNAQSQYNQAYYSYLSSDNTRSLARSSFLQLLNLDKDPSITVTVDSAVAFKEHVVDLEKCIALAYENRADLKINELSVKSAQYGERVAKSQQLPRIDLTGTVGRSGEVFTAGKLQMSDEWYVGAKVNVPWGPDTLNYSYTNDNIAPSLTVFTPTSSITHSVKFNILDNLASYTEAQRSEIIYNQAYSDLVKAKQTAATEVREAYFNYQETVLKLRNSGANKELYQKELAIMKEKRLMNEAQTQDVVQVKVKLATEETNYNAALIENLVAVAKLNKAVGIKNYLQ